MYNVNGAIWPTRPSFFRLDFESAQLPISMATEYRRSGGKETDFTLSMTEGL